MNWKRWGLMLVIVVGTGLTAWLVYQFAASERTQMLRRQASFLHALETGSWSKVDAMISNDYADEFGQDATLLKQNMRMAFGKFFFMKIDAQTTKSDSAKGLAWVKQTIKITGTGAGFSMMVVNESQRIKEPWIFHWHKRGFWPWSWELVQVHNPQANFTP
jgi:hypothetical protein